jgi:DNA-binding transcriptional MerR regulator
MAQRVFFLLLRYALCSLRYALKPGTPLALSQATPMDRQEQPVSIQHLSLRLKIPKSTLRFWEREFQGVLVPLRTKGGQRRYTLENMSVIRKIKELREKEMSLAQIHAHLIKRYRSNMDNLNPSKIDFLANRVAEVVRDEVYRFFQREG